MEIDGLNLGGENRFSQIDQHAAKVRKFSDLKPSKGVSNLAPEEKARYAEAARGFEAMFVNMMMKEMKQGMLDKTSLAGDGEKMTFGADTLEGYTDMLFAEQVSKTGTGIGIADMIYKQMTGGDKLANITNHAPRSMPKATMMPMAENMIPPRGRAITKSPIATNPIDNLPKTALKRIEHYEPIINEAAQITGLDKDLLKAVIMAESAGRPDAVSSAGAKGMMQLMDGTASDMRVRNVFDPKDNIMGGSKYLSQMLERYDGDVEKALAAYNAGPGNVDKYGGTPPFKETQNYVLKVARYHNMFANQGISLGEEDYAF